MKNRETSQGWSLNQGLAAQYAAQAGINPDLAAEVGEAAWDVLKALRDTTEERDPNRKAKRVALTKRRLRKAGLSRHRDLVKSIQGRLASLEGERPSINPATGLQEYFWPFGSRKEGEERTEVPKISTKSLQGQSNRLAPEANDLEWAEKQYQKFFVNHDDVGAHPERDAIFSEFKRRINPSEASLSVSPTPMQYNDYARIQGVKPEAYLNAEPALPETQASWNRKVKRKSGEEVYPTRDNFSGTGAAGQFFAGPDNSLYVLRREHLSDDPMFNYYTTLRDEMSKSQNAYDLKQRDMLRLVKNAGPDNFVPGSGMR